MPTAPATLPAPSPTPPPSPTPADPAVLANRLLRANPDPRCLNDNLLYCNVPWAVRILEHLRQYPDTPQRAELVERLADLTENSSHFSLDWLVARWFDEAVRQTIEAAGGQLPQGFAEPWQQRGEIREVDLDADSVPDYLVTFRIGEQRVAERKGGIGWVHRVGDSYVVETLPTTIFDVNFPVQPDILAVRDMNGDERADVVYRLTTCGAATCFEHLRIFSWRDGAWWDLMPVTWSTTNGSWELLDRGGGVVEVAGQVGHPGYDLGPLVAYRVHFAPINGEFAPVRVSSDLSPTQSTQASTQISPDEQLDTDATFLQWSQRLTYSRRLTEALAFIQPVAERPEAAVASSRPFLAAQ